MSSLIFKELVSILVLFNYKKKNYRFRKFCHWFVPVIEGSYPAFCGNSILNSISKVTVIMSLTV